uniref:hypothetical protein n=1 Tax=Clostridium sp. NkU-1 TaxID=1095009 RepID=UPI000A6D0E6C
MEQIMNCVKPELILVAVVLYFLRHGIKQSQAIKDTCSPLVNGAAGIVLYGNPS